MPERGSDKRGAKLLASASFVIIASFMAYPGFFDRRARGDEANLALDIYQLLREGATVEFSYGAGQAYFTFIAVVLRLLGLPYDATNALSPFIAGVCLSSMVAFLYFIYRGESGDWVGVIPIAAGFFPFAGFIGILSETSHKALIHAIVYMSLYLTWRFYRRENDSRLVYLLIGSLCAVSFFNIYWGVIYSGMFVLALLIEGITSRRIHELRALPAIPALTILTIVAYLPTVTKPPLIILVRVRRLFGESTTPSTSAASAGTFISDWGALTVFGIDISVWFLYTAGIFVIGVLSAVAFAIAFSRLARRKSNPSDRLLVIVLSTFGVILVGMAAAGSLPAFRRLLVFPGIVGLVFWMVYISEKRNSLSSPNIHTVLTVATVAIIATSAIVAVPRLAPDGHNNPYDKFNDQADISRIEFALENQQSDCLVSTEDRERNVARVVFGQPLDLKRPIPPPTPSTHSKVYSSKTEAALYC
jgi:hypothetical protein